MATSVNPCAAILPRIIICDRWDFFLRKANRPIVRKPVVVSTPAKIEDKIE